VPLTGWTLHAAAKKLYKATASEVVDTRQLYVNGKRATRARDGEDLTAAEVIAPRLEQLLILEGTVQARVHHMRFEGLELHYTTWLRPNTNLCHSDARTTSIERWAPKGLASSRCRAATWSCGRQRTSPSSGASWRSWATRRCSCPRAPRTT
jgi:hypothetical protein